MSNVVYKRATKSDIPGMARIRATNPVEDEHWRIRISRYMDGEHHPRQALMPRVIYVAIDSDSLVGFIAGHLTRRYKCDGELQWINVVEERQRSGIASELLRCLAEWFTAQNAARICVDVDPANAAARRFYMRHGAESLNPHWLVWDDVQSILRTPRRSTQ